MKNSRIFALALCGICLLGGCGSRNGEEREKEFWCRPLGKEGAGTLIGIQPYGVNKADSDFMYSLWMMDVKQETNGMKAYDHEGNLLQEFQCILA